jgi:hypothetical protein
MYVTVDATGKEHRKDAYAAIWEHINGVPFRAPRRRYRQPIFMDPESFAWRPSATDADVLQRHLGSFSECETQLDQFRLAPGASLHLQPHSLYFILSGKGTAGGEPCARFSTMQLDFDEVGELHATEETLMLRIGLPDLRFVEPALIQAETTCRGFAPSPYALSAN